MSTSGTDQPDAKRAFRYRLVGMLMLVAGFTNVGASFASDNGGFAIAGSFFFVAAVFYFVSAHRLATKGSKT